jgi:hypothetical protein
VPVTVLAELGDGGVEVRPPVPHVGPEPDDDASNMVHDSYPTRIIAHSPTLGQRIDFRPA